MTTMSPPVSPSQRDGRPRMNTGASYLSNRSRRSSTSTNKLDLVETSKDKRRLHTKADPSTALKEAQPAAVALEESNLEDIRRMQHKDVDGNIITDPDRSNPTRYRLERPLDTIRAFNAAADGTSNRRSSYQNRPPPGSSYNGQDNRRSSYYGNAAFSPQQRPRPGPGPGPGPGPSNGPSNGNGGYYRNSSYGFRPEWYSEEPAPPQPPYGRPPRSQGQPYHGSGESSSSHGNSYHQSYETMTSGSDDYGKSTNPSSQNSSFDRLHQMHSRKPDEYGQYGDEIQPVSPPPNAHGPYPPHNGQNGFHPRQMQSMQRNSPFSQGPNNPRQPIQLTNSNSGPPPTRADLNKDLPPKRQSWIRRKLSRKDSSD